MDVSLDVIRPVKLEIVLSGKVSFCDGIVAVPNLT